MEKTLIASGKTIELAKEAALTQLGLTEDDLISYEVLSLPKAGFLGFGAQPAKVMVKYEVPDPVVEKPKSALGSASRSKPKAAPAPAPMAAPAGFPGKVVSMNRSGNAQEIVRYHPTSFQDSKEAAKDLVASKAVIVNLEELDKDASRRMVDFLSGVVFAMDGDVQKVAPNVYVFCPPNVFITGGPEEVQPQVENLF